MARAPRSLLRLGSACQPALRSYSFGVQESSRFCRSPFTMKSRKLLGFVIGILSADPALGQGIVRNANNITGVMRALIYGVDPADPFFGRPGPNGFGGPLLQGTGYTIQLWGVGGTTLNQDALLPAISG